MDLTFDYLRSRPGVDTARMAAAGGSCGVGQALARRRLVRSRPWSCSPVPAATLATVFWPTIHGCRFSPPPASTTGGRWPIFLEPGGAKRLAEKLGASGAEAVALPPENAINTEGYRLITAGATKKAIELLAFNVEAFAHSANALDSLADAYLADGQTEKAAELARRAIAAIPGDTAITEALAQAIRQSAKGKLAEQ